MRQIWDIHGGIHPTENKLQSLQYPIMPAGIPDTLVFPLSQHIGAPASPTVKVGERVLKGQMIARAEGFVSVPVHASTSGTVTAISNHPIPHPSGMTGLCIIVEADQQDQWATLPAGISDISKADRSELLERIREAGIAGMGGAGFPAAVKLKTRDDQRIETLIINGTECEPYITADDILMRERAADIIAGVQILQHIIEPSRETLIGVEDNKPEAIAALQKAAEGTGIEVVVFPTKYPSGGEKQLIQILTGKEVPSGGLPADVGIVCQNIGTTVAINDAIRHGKPLISRITTVTGDGVQRQQNYEVLLGTPIAHLLALSHAQTDTLSRLIMGGPMMGFALTSTDIPVVKTTNCLLVPSPQELPLAQPAQACIRCGMCAEACPVELLPQQLYWFARAKNHDQLKIHNLFDCIECGACSYVCPSNIPLVQYYRASKAAIRQAEVDQSKSEHSKARFEARQARLERQEQEKEAKRQARKAAAAQRQPESVATADNSDQDDKAALIAAAVERSKARKAQQHAEPNAPAATEDGQPAATDPAQAAIARAQARRDGTAVDGPDSIDSLRADIDTIQKRLAKAEEKLAGARAEGSDNIAAFQTGVDKTRAKLEAAQQKLAALENSAPASDKPNDSTAVDPVQAAIERAQAKRAGLVEAEDPRTKLHKDISSLEKRIAKTRDKLQQAEQDGDPTTAVLASSLQTMQDKLDKAQRELEAL